MPSMSRRFALREATQATHERLDGTVGEWADLRSYSRYLKAMAVFRSAAEDALLAAPWPVAWSYRPVFISSGFEADLRDLGLQVGERDIALPPIGSASGLLGTLYVLEGSAFGAKLLRQRAARIGLGDSFGARHLGLMVGTGGAWRDFLSVLDAEPEYDAEGARAAAEAAFRAALSCFQGASRVAA